jgi:hypothetical protein
MKTKWEDVIQKSQDVHQDENRFVGKDINEFQVQNPILKKVVEKYDNLFLF